jgi:hypothetical protein
MKGQRSDSSSSSATPGTGTRKIEAPAGIQPLLEEAVSLVAGLKNFVQGGGGTLNLYMCTAL